MTTDRPSHAGEAPAPPRAEGSAGRRNRHEGHRQRLRGRLLAGGGEDLADYELLELILMSAIPRRDVKPIAKDLLDRFKTFNGVINATPVELQRVDGLGEAGAAALLAVRSAAVRLLKDTMRDQPVLSSWDRLLDYCQAAMGHNKVEQFRILFLDIKNRLIADEVQQQGTVNHTAVYPREVVRRAIELGASAIIMVHNHPSGDVTPSKADIAITRQVQDACNALNVTLHDHLIVARANRFSFRSEGIL